jgi:hypothetical protein
MPSTTIENSSGGLTRSCLLREERLREGQERIAAALILLRGPTLPANQNEPDDDRRKQR